MIEIQQIDTRNRRQVDRFIRLPFRLYADDPNWTPVLWTDMRTQLDQAHFPFYEHSQADFFLAVCDGRDVGRIAAIENRHFNEYHGTRKAQFYYFESENDPEIAAALFNRLFEWAHQRKLDTVIGPKGLSIMDGYGMLVEGFDRPQMMSSMTHNQPYLVQLVEGLGFTKEVDFISCYADLQVFQVPERIHHIAERVQQRGTLKVKSFANMKELKAWSWRIGQAYNQTFVNNWEYAPLTEREVAFVVKTLETVADPPLIKVILHKEEVVGFLFAFPELGAAIRRNHGRLFPFGLPDLLLEMRRTRWVAVNAAGILPEFQGHGGNALLYSEMDKTVRTRPFRHLAFYQVAETAVQMRRDLINLGGEIFKNHRVFRREV